MEKSVVEIAFRAHHFLCALCFQGNGYSPAFVANFQTIMEVLRGKDGDNITINIVSETDSICAPCPNRQGSTCQTEEKIRVLDDAHAAVLGWKTETNISWGEAKTRIATQLTLEKFHTMCNTCSWKQYGICEGVLKEFLPS